MFWPQFFFWGGSPQILDSHHKIQLGSNNVAKFRGDRSRELRDLGVEKNITAKT